MKLISPVGTSKVHQRFSLDIQAVTESKTSKSKTQNYPGIPTSPQFSVTSSTSISTAFHSPIPSPVRRRPFAKTVRFAPDDRVHEISNKRHDLTNKQKSSYWFNSADYRRIRRENKEEERRMIEQQQLEELMSSASFSPDNAASELHIDVNDIPNIACEDVDFCRDGWNYETHSFAKQKAMHKLMAVRVVLNEQERQGEEAPDQEAIAKLYGEFCAKCRHAAHISSLRTERRQRRRGMILN